MAQSVEESGVLAAWRTSARVTAFLIEHIPNEVWHAVIPGAPRRTVQMIGGHVHNARCMWVQMLGRRHGLAAPRRVDRRRATQRQVVAALAESGRAIGRLLEVGLANGGHLPGFSPPDVTHFMAYHVAHEGHHRGQIVMVARQLGHRLPAEVTNGLWQWARRRRETARRGS
jgi:uncharacterized damage-inducible protein DinB